MRSGLETAILRISGASNVWTVTRAASSSCATIRYRVAI